MQNRAGAYVPHLSGELRYRYFLPTPLPPNPPLIIDDEMASLLARASLSVGQLEGVSRQLPSTNLFVSMYVRKEALLSSQIEGTQATLDDILDPHRAANVNLNVAEVVNYIKASHYATNRLKELPLCNRLLRETHAVLMSGLRGNEKDPGQFRRSQNWIGPAGGTLKTAIFIPPIPEEMNSAMSNLEKYMNESDGLHALIKAALLHYQFETIHPFLDGNGRVGRLLIQLFLMSQGLLSYETLYISYFLKRSRVEYYDRLTEVRRTGNFEQWVKFFLLALDESARDAIDSMGEITLLHRQDQKVIESTGRSAKTLAKVFEYLLDHPIIDIGTTGKVLGLAYNTIAKAVETLVDMGVLAQTDNVRRNRVFAYENYLKILRRGTELELHGSEVES
ncbi:MAG TPA: Fic family protein [Bacillota bacterium]|nr:Fic family protein [Bacillota bacterium]